jgi:hypothetical protein
MCILPVWLISLILTLNNHGERETPGPRGRLPARAAGIPSR